MSKPLKKVFKTTEKAFEDGKEVEREVELAIRTPTGAEQQKARHVYAKAWADAVKDGAMVKQALDKYLKAQGLWDDARDQEFQRLRRQILDGERRLKAGGNAGLTRSAARELALQIADWRSDMADLLTERNRVEANTADALADQAQFNYLTAACTVYNSTGRPYFTDDGFEPSVGRYADRATEKATMDAASHFAEMYYDIDSDDPSSKLPEQKFLREYGFADAKGRLINKDGHLVDRQGRLINEDNRFVDKDGNFIDADGRPVDADGQYVVDFAPFLED